MTPEIKKLLNGNKEFRKKFFISDNSIYNDLILFGQKPKIMVVGCSDSRVDPAMVFNTLPGELFVIRNVANLIPPYEINDTYHGISAALEFGTCFLEVENIIVFGHTQCGGIRALFENTCNVLDKSNNSFIAKWLELARRSYEKVVNDYSQLAVEDKITICEQYTLINSLKNLQTFPWIQERVSKGILSLHAWYFDLATGTIYIYDIQKNIWFFLTD